MTMLSVIKLELFNTYTSNFKKKEELGFKFVNIATKNKIGIKVGWNVWKGFWGRLDSSVSNEILIELLDNPMVNYIEELFWGKGIENYEQRMNKIQNFLQEIFDIKEVKKIILDIDAYDTEEEVVEQKVPVISLKPKDFINLMFKLHEENEQWTPTVRLVMSK